MTVSSGFKAVLFDLLTGLLDSWALWSSVAGNFELGCRWRDEYLKITYQTGSYLPYEGLVADAAEAVGLPRGTAAELASHFDLLKPWPDVRETLQALANHGVPLGLVTNCSEHLGRVAAKRVGVHFDVLVTAERAGFYKPDPHPYQLALQELGVPAEHCLFVAGSAYDLIGTAKVGLPTYWHDRIGMKTQLKDKPPADPPLIHASDLKSLRQMVIA